MIVLFFRLSEAGLLTIGRLVESGSVNLDRSLLTALVDRWRPETNTFHLPCGEMTPTLQDVAMLLGLPISCDTDSSSLPKHLIGLGSIIQVREDTY